MDDLSVEVGHPNGAYYKVSDKNDDGCRTDDRSLLGLRARFGCQQY